MTAAQILCDSVTCNVSFIARLFSGVDSVPTGGNANNKLAQGEHEAQHCALATLTPEFLEILRVGGLLHNRPLIYLCPITFGGELQVEFLLTQEPNDQPSPGDKIHVWAVGGQRQSADWW